ncbi:MAG: hypothetical protein IJ416_04530 [Ruminiclostridium sp.]|nr:hypothetical protein [Ruminiclostridium sp.]
MKMTKLLATGLAASIAAGSLATFASAEELSFNMGKTEGRGEVSNILAYYITDADFLDGLADSGVTGSIVIPYANNVTGARVVITGKLKGESVSRTTTYECKNNWWSGYELKIITEAVNEGGEINFSAYDEITSVEVYLDYATTFTDAASYENWWGINVGADWGAPVSGWANGIQVSGSSSILDTLGSLLASSSPAAKWYDQTKKETKVKYPFLLVTDGYIKNEYIAAKDDNTLERQEIYVLSDADAWEAINGGAGIGGDTDTNQTYDDQHLGTVPVAFAGFASQVADFFNKQTNGTITFKFTAAAGSSSSANWGNAGIPSTQVGIKNALNGEWTNEDFALFFNYDQTGSLQASAAVDVAAGEVTFDIADVLDDLGGQTKGVIDNVYYGLTKGNDVDVDYNGQNDSKGLAIETVTFAYDADAADEDIVEDDADDAEEDDDVVEDDADDADDAEEDDDVAIEDDDDEDDDVAVEDDDDDDDASVEGTDDVVTTPSDDDDANPATGVALAVVPALVAAAAAVVSKKRK